MPLFRLAAVLALVAAPAAAQGARAGLYVAGDRGWQHVIGGAQYGGNDVLADDVRPVTSFALGLRFEARRWVFGGDFGFGQTDGNLRRVDPAIPLTVEYRNSSQSHFGAHLGGRIDRDWIAYGYLSETRRDFDVTLTDGSGTTAQSDQQGILRFGIAAERAVRPWLSWRVTFGTARAKFEGPTRGDPDREVEFGLGLLLVLMGEPR